MQELVIGLLMFIGVEMKEHTYYDNLSACLKAKRISERNARCRGPPGPGANNSKRARGHLRSAVNNRRYSRGTSRSGANDRR